MGGQLHECWSRTGEGSQSRSPSPPLSESSQLERTGKTDSNLALVLPIQEQLSQNKVLAEPAPSRAYRAQSHLLSSPGLRQAMAEADKRGQEMRPAQVPCLKIKSPP